MKVYRFTASKDKESFRVPSTTVEGTYYTIDRLHTTDNTYVYRCECIGYLTRQNKNVNFECKHIKAVKEFEEAERKFNDNYNGGTL